MISFPISLLLIPYAIFLIVFLVFAIVNVYHLIHYGQTTKVSFGVTFVFFAMTALILFLTWKGLQGVDWTYPIDIAFPTFGSGAPPSL